MSRLARFDKCKKCDMNYFGYPNVIYHLPKIREYNEVGVKFSLTKMESIIYSLLCERLEELPDYKEGKLIFTPELLYYELDSSEGFAINNQFQILSAILSLAEKGIIFFDIIHGKVDMMEEGFLHAVFEIECNFLNFIE